MLKDITIGQYFPTNSIIHKLDPRTKIIFTFALMISLFLTEKYPMYLFVTISILIVINISKIPVKVFLKSIRPMIMLLIFTFLLNIFLTPGEVIYKFYFLNITREGIDLGIKMLIRLVLLIITASLLMYTTTPIQLTDAIEKLINPLRVFKVPTHEIAMMMTIALRFVPTLLEETDKIMKAQMSRGADFESKNFINRAKSMIPLLVPLFISAFRRADELAMAMESRCYNGGVGKTRMNEIKFKKIDLYAFLILAIYLAVVIAGKILL